MQRFWYKRLLTKDMGLLKGVLRGGSTVTTTTTTTETPEEGGEASKGKKRSNSEVLTTEDDSDEFSVSGMKDFSPKKPA